MTKHRHLWSYFAGCAKCKCGKFLQPDGKVTDTPSGRKKVKTSPTKQRKTK